MNLPLMPKATAIWLVENTSLTFNQIAEFCGLHILEIEIIANGNLDSRMIGLDPIVTNQLTIEEIKRCEADPNANLTLSSVPYLDNQHTKSSRYTPRSKRQDKPDAIAWIVKYYPEVSDIEICRLLGTTKATIASIRNKTYRNYAKISPKSPIVLGLCSESELDYIIAKFKREL